MENIKTYYSPVQKHGSQKGTIVYNYLRDKTF